MNGTLFTFDANVLIYYVTAGDARQVAAQDLLRRAAEGRCILTLQALGEFFWSSTRKRIVTRQDAAAQVRRWLAVFPSPPPASIAAMETALAASEAGRFGYWDAMLLATAGEAGCTAVISEDMAPGATLGPVRLVPAFRDGAASPEALALLG